MGSFFCRRTKGVLRQKRSRFVLRLGCPPEADNSTLAQCKVFSPTYTPPEKTDSIDFLPAGKKLCEAFLTVSGTVKTVPYFPFYTLHSTFYILHSVIGMIILSGKHFIFSLYFTHTDMVT